MISSMDWDQLGSYDLDLCYGLYNISDHKVQLDHGFAILNHVNIDFL